MHKRILLAVSAAALVAACSQPKTGAADAAASAATAPSAETTPAEIPMPAEPPFDASGAPAGLYKSDPGHAYISFGYNHMGYSNPIVRWGSWGAELNWDPSVPEKSSVSATIDVASIDTGVDKLDEHLKSADFFDAATYPTIAFKSSSLTLSGPNSATLTGDLTIKDVTKPVTLDVRINRAADDGFAKAYKLGFSAKGMIKRSDFGVDLYAPMVSDEVPFSVETEFVMPKAEQAQ